VVGQRPPAVLVENLDGAVVRLDDYVGQKPVFVEFWATWCGVCRALKPRIEAAHRKYRDQVEFFIVAVSVSQTRKLVAQYLRESALPGTVVYDGTGGAMTAFGVGGTGYVFLLNAQGLVTYAGVGPTQDVEGAIERLLNNK